MSVRLKKRDVSESRYCQTISSRSSSRLLEQVEDQGMRGGKAVYTTRDSCYHKEKGAEKTLGGGVKGTITHQLQKFTPTWARISSDRNVFCTLGEGGQRRGPMPLGFFLSR